MQNIESYGIVGRVSQSGPSDSGHVNEGTQSQPFQPPPASTQVNLYFRVSITFEILNFIFELIVTTSSYKR